MTRSRNAFTFLAAAVALALSSTAGAASPNDSSTAVLPNESEGIVDQATVAVFERQFAESQGISVDDAHKAFADNGPLLDFIAKWKDDPGFGAVWVTYDGGYQRHVRLLSDRLLPAVDQLAADVGGPVDVRRGGASHADLEATVEELRKGLGVAGFVNSAEGTLDLYAGSHALPANAKVPAPIRHLAESAPVVTPMMGPRTGADIYYWYGSAEGWVASCTAGFMWGGFGISGYATAGHCPDPNTSSLEGVYSAVGASQVVAESCPSSSTLDYQLIKFAVPDDQSELGVIKTYNPYGVDISIAGIAGGFYEGQQTYKVGLWYNDVYGSNWGVAVGWESPGSAPGGDCLSETGAVYFKTTNHALPGDSGGPIYVYWDNQFYLAAITHGGIPGIANTWSTWIGWIPMPGFSSIHICTVPNPCN